MANLFKSIGKTENALRYYRKIVAVKPDSPKEHSNLLLTMHYRTFDPNAIFIEHQKWESLHTAKVTKPLFSLSGTPPKNRRLRIGYVSPDFRKHSVSYFIEPILAGHNRSSFEVICYSDVVHYDSVTEHLRCLSDSWNDTSSLTDQQLAEKIKNDRIDILVDLAGHTANNRLLVFARKPAPIQVTYLGYPNTTGLKTIDYRITDTYADPVGATDQYHSEQLLRLPQSFLCYSPASDSPEPSQLPALEKGSITFGSFNDRAKISSEMLELWSAILQAQPKSELILKSTYFTDTKSKQDVVAMFRNKGILPERIRLLSAVASHQKHLGLYNNIDICLDTFPYNGTTTTCEALWMGIPVITLTGKTHVSRVGYSLLNNLGLTDLCTFTPEEYRAKAQALASDLVKLSQIRSNLRSRMEGSIVTDRTKFVQSLETAYRNIWEFGHQTKESNS